MSEQDPFGQPQRVSEEDSRRFFENLSKQYGASVGSTDVQDLANKNPEDVSAFQQAMTNQYAQRGASNGGGTISAPGGYTGSSSSSWSGSTSNSPMYNGNWGPQATSLWSTLLGRAGQNIIPNYRDPLIAAQTNAYGAQQTRAGRNYINELAERSGPTANLQGERRMMAEKAGQSTGMLQSQLMQNELAARRQEVAQALQLQAGMLSDQQRLALQQELGLADLSLQAADRANYWNALYSGLF